MSVWMNDNRRLPYHGRLARAKCPETAEPELIHGPRVQHGRDARDTPEVAIRIALLCVTILFVSGFASAADVQIGVAKTDITPSTPIRLTGYAARKTESEGVEQKLYARGLAIGTSKADAVILVTLDTMAVPHEVTDEVAGRPRGQIGLHRRAGGGVALPTHPP